MSDAKGPFDPEDSDWGRNISRQASEAASKREIDIRFAAMSDAIAKLEKNMNERFVHSTEMFSLAQEGAKRAVDKAEGAQHAHNVAANEWRSTLNDFKTTLVGRSEFDRFYSEFSAYRLEQSRQMSLSAGVKQEKAENREDWKSIVALIVAIASAVVTFMMRHA
jgi:hypothetical protein